MQDTSVGKAAHMGLLKWSKLDNLIFTSSILLHLASLFCPSETEIFDGIQTIKGKLSVEELVCLNELDQEESKIQYLT